MMYTRGVAAQVRKGSRPAVRGVPQKARPAARDAAVDLARVRQLGRLDDAAVDAVQGRGVVVERALGLGKADLAGAKLLRRLRVGASVVVMPEGGTPRPRSSTPWRPARMNLPIRVRSAWRLEKASSYSASSGIRGRSRDAADSSRVASPSICIAESSSGRETKARGPTAVGFFSSSARWRRAHWPRWCQGYIRDVLLLRLLHAGQGPHGQGHRSVHDATRSNSPCSFG